MSQQVLGSKAFTATAAVEAYRLVKLTAGSGTAVEKSGAGEAPIGITESAAAIGAQVSVALKSSTRSYKATASKAIAVGAALYAAADGKVSDAANGTSVGTALEEATANNDVIEVLLDNGTGVTGINGSTPANIADGGHGIPFVIIKSFADAASGDTAIYAAAAPFKFRVIDAVFENRGANGANANTVQLCAAAGGASPITDAMSTNNKADKDLVRPTTIDDATAVVAASGSLYIARTRAGGVLTGELRITAIRVA
jgi:hypothetical protein